jgi:hypothetical protein
MLWIFSTDATTHPSINTAFIDALSLHSQNQKNIHSRDVIRSRLLNVVGREVSLRLRGASPTIAFYKVSICSSRSMIVRT